MDALKSKVLKELIDVLDQEDGKMLMKHPKVMAAKITVAKPIEKGAMLDKPEMKEEMEGEGEEEMESPDEVVPDIMEDFDELPDEVKAKLLKMLSK